jgi:NCS1 family nucleobase:cation symporter-1
VGPILTTVSAFNGQTRTSPVVRAAYIVGFIAVSVLIAVAASADFLDNFKNFVLVLLMVFIPWSAINLTDYYLISKDNLDIPALYDPAGRYGKWDLAALGCYVLGSLRRSHSSRRSCTPGRSPNCLAELIFRGSSGSS